MPAASGLSRTWSTLKTRKAELDERPFEIGSAAEANYGNIGAPADRQSGT
jgi:hypothetical protein